MVQMGLQVINGTLEFEVNAPRDASIIPPGYVFLRMNIYSELTNNRVYLIFVVLDGIPSEGTWIALS